MRQFKHGMMYLLLYLPLFLVVSCGGSSANSTSQLVSSEVEEIQGTVTVAATDINLSANLLSLSSNTTVTLQGSSDQAALAGVTVIVRLAKNGTICGVASTESDGSYEVALATSYCREQFSANQTFRVDACSALQTSSATASNCVSGYFSLSTTAPTAININQRSTLVAGIIDYNMLSVGLTQANTSKATAAAETEYDPIETLYKDAVTTLAGDFFGELSTAQCAYQYQINSAVSATSATQLHLLDCADDYLKDSVDSSRLSTINGLFTSAPDVADQFFSAQVQFDESGNVADSGFSGKLEFGITVTENLGTSLAGYKVKIPSGLNGLSNLEMGQYVSFDNSDYDSETVWDGTTFTGLDISTVPGKFKDPNFNYVVSESSLDPDKVTGSVYTTNTDYTVLSTYCTGNCFQSDGASKPEGTSAVKVIPGCTISSACNYSSTATINDGSCLIPTACDTCNTDGSIKLNVFCTACAVDEYVSNSVCKACDAGTTNVAGDMTTLLNTSCDVTVCATNEYVSSNTCKACPVGTTNAGGDLANGLNTLCGVASCSTNQYVLNNVCTACPLGTTNASGDLANGLDTSCDATLCAKGQYVLNNACTSCSSTSINVAGDDASGSDTSCDACGVNEISVNNVCVNPITVSLSVNYTSIYENRYRFKAKGVDIDGDNGGDQFGQAVAISDDGLTLVVGAIYNDDAATDAGQVKVYTWNGSAWVQKGGSLLGFNAGDFFGSSVAVSEDGSIIAVSAINYSGAFAQNGLVQLYEWTGGIWNKKGASIEGEAYQDWSGETIALSSDGTIIAIGSAFNDGKGDRAGHVRLFKWDGFNWNQLGLDIDGENAFDRASTGLDLALDGMRVAVGSATSSVSGPSAGHVRVFDWDGSSWVQVGSSIDGVEAYGYSGSGLAMSSDGTTLAIGAPYSYGAGSSRGSVRVFSLDGSNWVQLGAEFVGDSDYDTLGAQVALSNDGERVVIGVPGDDGSSTDVGSVKVFDWNGTVWLQAGTDIKGEAQFDGSASDISLSGDGTVLAIGAKSNDGGGSDSGHVRVYEPEALDTVATVTGTLNQVAPSNVVLTLTASGTASGSGVDYTLSSTTLTILAGQTSGTATVTAVQDVISDDGESVVLTTSSVQGATVVPGSDQISISILENFAPLIIINIPSA